MGAPNRLSFVYNMDLYGWADVGEAINAERAVDAPVEYLRKDYVVGLIKEHQKSLGKSLRMRSACDSTKAALQSNICETDVLLQQIEGEQ